jgi:Bacterial PH domain
MQEFLGPLMPPETIRWYRSKVDWWLALMLCVPPVASISPCVSLALSGKPAEWEWGVGGVLLIFGVYFAVIFPMRYGLDETDLAVQFGLGRRRIPLADILEVYPTHNPQSSPALSLDRLHVQFGPGFFKAVMISPADRSRFLDDLAKKAQLKRDGDRLVRV